MPSSLATLALESRLHPSYLSRRARSVLLILAKPSRAPFSLPSTLSRGLCASCALFCEVSLREYRREVRKGWTADPGLDVEGA